MGKFIGGMFGGGGPSATIPVGPSPNMWSGRGFGGPNGISFFHGGQPGFNQMRPQVPPFMPGQVSQNMIPPPPPAPPPPAYPAQSPFFPPEIQVLPSVGVLRTQKEANRGRTAGVMGVPPQVGVTQQPGLLPQGPYPKTLPPPPPSVEMPVRGPQSVVMPVSPPPAQQAARGVPPLLRDASLGQAMSPLPANPNMNTPRPGITGPTQNLAPKGAIPPPPPPVQQSAPPVNKPTLGYPSEVELDVQPLAPKIEDRLTPSDGAIPPGQARSDQWDQMLRDNPLNPNSMNNARPGDGMGTNFVGSQANVPPPPTRNPNRIPPPPPTRNPNRAAPSQAGAPMNIPPPPNEFSVPPGFGMTGGPMPIQGMFDQYLKKTGKPQEETIGGVPKSEWEYGGRVGQNVTPSAGTPSTVTPLSDDGVVGFATVPPNETIALLRSRIAGNESAGSGGYSARGPEVKDGQYKGQRAMGKYQVMPGNLPSWSMAALGREVSVAEFMANPAIQDAIFDDQMAKNLAKYGNVRDVASVWFTGQPYAVGKNRDDDYITGAQYIAKAGL